MATTLGTENLTLVDWARRLDPDGKLANVAEVLNETNEVLDDMQWVEGNLSNGHVTTVRTGIPDPTWRKLYSGVLSTKSTTKQVTDVTGMLEARPYVDVDLAKMNGLAPEWRLAEERPHIEGMNQTMADTIFHGDTDLYPERFMGLHPRFNSLTADNGSNIIDAGGSGSDNTSIWLVCWGPNTVHGIFPKGTIAGLQVEDKGIQTITDTTTGRYDVYESHYQWKAGLSVRDWRYVVRIANIDVSDLGTFNTAADASANLIRLLVQAIETLPELSLGKPVLYCNKTIRTWMRIQMMERYNVFFNFDNLAGKKVLTFSDVPVKRVDKILSTESTIS
jgi:hypothetical protein